MESLGPVAKVNRDAPKTLRVPRLRSPAVLFRMMENARTTPKPYALQTLNPKP